MIYFLQLTLRLKWHMGPSSGRLQHSIPKKIEPIKMIKTLLLILIVNLVKVFPFDFFQVNLIIIAVIR